MKRTYNREFSVYSNKDTVHIARRMQLKSTKGLIPSISDDSKLSVHRLSPKQGYLGLNVDSNILSGRHKDYYIPDII